MCAMCIPVYYIRMGNNGTQFCDVTILYIGKHWCLNCLPTVVRSFPTHYYDYIIYISEKVAIIIHSNLLSLIQLDQLETGTEHTQELLQDLVLILYKVYKQLLYI